MEPNLEGLGGDFKMLPKPVAGQLTALRPASRAEDKGTKEGDFKNWPLVYRAIVEHQRGADWWLNHDDLEYQRNWGFLFIKAFDLRVKDSAYMAMPLIRIEPMNVRTIGIYRSEADGYAIIGTIALNEERLTHLPDFMKLVVLLKLLLCARQHQSGGDGTFDRECRERMKAVGLVITDDGAITIDADGLFRRILAECGIDVQAASVFPRPCRKGKTTNRLWSCTCQKVRVGTQEFFAVCTQCNEPFRLGDHVGKRFVRPGRTAVPARA